MIDFGEIERCRDCSERWGFWGFYAYHQDKYGIDYKGEPVPAPNPEKPQQESEER